MRSQLLIPTLALVLALIGPDALGQFGSRVESKAAFEPAQAAPGDLVTLRIEASIRVGFYFYAPDSSPEGGIPSRIEYTETGGLVQDGDLTFTEPTQKWDEIFEVNIRILRGKPVFQQSFRIPENARGEVRLKGVLHTQVCDDSTCVLEDPGFEATLSIEVPDEFGDEAEEQVVPRGKITAPRVVLTTEFVPKLAAPGQLVTLRLRAAIGGSYHMYAPSSPAGMPAGVKFGSLIQLEPEGELTFSDPEVKYDDIFEDDVHLYTGEAIFEQKFRVGADVPAGELSVTGTLTGQACDESTCTDESLPFRQSLTVGLADVAAAGGTAADQADPPSPSSVRGGEDLETISLPAFLLLAVFWGLITLLMPCTYPMIPITISFFTKQAIAREGKVLPLSLAYGAGIVLIFILIGVVLGAPIISFAQHPVTNLVIGGLFLFFALVLFGAIDLQPPRFLMAAAGKASTRSGLTGVFLMGATLVVTSFTCTAPFVGSLLSVGAGDGNLFRIVLGMGVFGLTMATPFVLLSLVPGRLQKMPQAGEWMHVLKVFLGFVELAAALKFISNSDLVWSWQVLSRELFLVLWFGIFLVAALFLFGWIHLKGESEREIGPWRMVAATCTLLFALYCGMGSRGYELDDIMTAIVPNYSQTRSAGSSFGSTGSRPASAHQIVKDDYQQATRQALAQDKLLLVNFTGHT